MNPKIIKIKLKKLISDKLISRGSVLLIKRLILKLSDPQEKVDLIVELDFINIKFISMCFTDELRNLERSLLKSKVKLVFVNTNKDIDNLFRIVDKHRLEPRIKRPKFKAKVRNLDSLACQF